MTNHVPLLEVKGLSKHYKVNTGALLEKKVLKAVDSLDVVIHEGDVFGLVGESGCGKTTFGQIAAGILQPSAGDILYKGCSLAQMNSNERLDFRRQVQMVLQDPYSSLNPRKRIGWLIEEPLVIHRRYTKARREELVREMMKATGLDPAIRRAFPGNLSGGQCQRVSIAASLILGAELIIADEPVSALDVSVQSQILNLFTELKEKNGLTILFISHNLNVVRYMANRIGVMYMGRIVETGGSEEVCTNPAHPYTQMLMSAVLSPDADPGTRKVIPRGEVPNPLDPPPGCPFHMRCVYAAEICKKENPAPVQCGPGHSVCCHIAAAQ